MNAFLPAGIESLFCLLKSTRQSMHGASEGGANSLLSTSTRSFSKYHKDEEVLARSATAKDRSTWFLYQDAAPDLGPSLIPGLLSSNRITGCLRSQVTDPVQASEEVGL